MSYQLCAQLGKLTNENCNWLAPSDGLYCNEGMKSAVIPTGGDIKPFLDEYRVDAGREYAG